ncbi:fatty acid--CoA ligase family protein [Nonomuraea wenchangensis]|uniref:class I adenylate-forming enzyme family protein n=1 Tax=Nonomuraea wenchangensis TaxID=568860 RepID=UPI0034431E76
MRAHSSAGRTWTARVLAQLSVNSDEPVVVSMRDGSVETWSRGEFLQMISGAVEFLTQSGTAEGDPVPALLATEPASVALLIAGSIARRPLAPLGPRMTPRELTACLRELPGKVLLSEPQWLALAEAAAAGTGKRVVVVEGPQLSAREPALSVSTDDTALFMHTSGTTGQPKQVRVRQAPLLVRTEVQGRVIGLRPGDRFVTAGLFHHVAGLGNIAVALANGAVLTMFPAFSVEAWRGLAAVEPTHAIMVPSIIEMLLAADAMRLPSLRVIAYGASPIHPDTMRRVQEVVPTADFVNLFGQTEGSPITVLDATDHRRARTDRPDLLLSVGRPAPGVELSIHEPDDHGVGEIWARMPHSFVHDEDGWQHTGDIGRIDAEGYVYLAGRKGDKIIRGGENVFPVEVEQVLETHPAVREAAVVGKPDRRLGETVKAYVVPMNTPDELDLEDLRHYARERLAGFKVPAEWEVLDVLPRNPSGKLLRRDLAARAVSE